MATVLGGYGSFIWGAGLCYLGGMAISFVVQHTVALLIIPQTVPLKAALQSIVRSKDSTNLTTLPASTQPRISISLTRLQQILSPMLSRIRDKNISLILVTKGKLIYQPTSTYVSSIFPHSILPLTEKTGTRRVLPTSALVPHTHVLMSVSVCTYWRFHIPKQSISSWRPLENRPIPFTCTGTHSGLWTVDMATIMPVLAS